MCSSRFTTSPSSNVALEVVDADVIGINNRDLTDFTVDVERTLRAAQRRASWQDRGLGVRLTTRAQIEELERVGIDAVLIGETLMRAPEPRSRCATSLATAPAPRTRCSESPSVQHRVPLPATI